MPLATVNVTELFVSFQGEGLHAGRRQLFVRLGGCPLRCRWCDTPESLERGPFCRVFAPEGMRVLPNPLPLDRLDHEVRRLQELAPPLHALAVTGGEPLAQAEALVAWRARSAVRLPVLLETAGILPGRLERVLPAVAIVSLDVKLPSNSGERPRWEEHAECIRLAVAAGREVYVKMPVDGQTDPDEVALGARLVAEMGRGVPLFLTPIAVPESATLTIDAGTLHAFHALASRCHPDVRVLPQLHKVLGIP